MKKKEAIITSVSRFGGCGLRSLIKAGVSKESILEILAKENVPLLPDSFAFKFLHENSV
jgi:hypothetical protein